jgi:hypothetical protein
MAGEPTVMTVLRSSLIPAAVTVLVFSPEFFRDPAAAESAPAVTIVWLAALVTSAPIAAYLVNRRRATATDVARSVLTGIFQLPLIMLLVAFDVWLDVRSGYLLAGSGEEAMAYGIGTTLSTSFGIILVALVALAARLGARRS